VAKGNQLGAPNQLFPDQGNPFAAQAPTLADAWQSNAQAYGQWLDAQRQEGIARGLIDPQTGWPTGNALVDAARQYGSALIGSTSAPGLRAFHGSPYSFDRFDLGKIGTGEGAQAYGHGMYFAENEGVARSYRDDLSVKKPPPELVAAQNAYNAAYDAAGKAMSGTDQEFNAAIAARDIAYQQMQKIKAAWEAEPKPQGHMYEVGINADPAQMLDWDKPLSEQHPNVQKALLPYVQAAIDKEYVTGNDPMKFTGGEAYSAASSVMPGFEAGGSGAPDVSSTLHQAGIPGIRYLDAGSRGQGDGTSNYVVFNPDTIAILRKYGIAGLMAGGAAAGAASQTDPTQTDPTQTDPTQTDPTQ
jgi:hypothetical protein